MKLPEVSRVEIVDPVSRSTWVNAAITPEFLDDGVTLRLTIALREGPIAPPKHMHAWSGDGRWPCACGEPSPFQRWREVILNLMAGSVLTTHPVGKFRGQHEEQS